MKKIDFWEACDVPTSLFDINYAKGNIKWMAANKIYNQQEKLGGIPNWLHFIWLGGELPKKYEDIVQSWRINNPHLNVFVWGDKEAEDLVKKHGPVTQNLFSSCQNFGQKSDILRYIILHDIGGIYSDIDFICVGNISEIQNVDFFAGICLERDFQLNNGLMASSKGHQILKNVFKRITLTGYSEIECKATRTLYQTGPWALTDAVNQYIFDSESLPNDIMFWPPNYFHPFPASKRFEGNWQDYVKDYSLAVHLWECSWQK